MMRWLFLVGQMLFDLLIDRGDLLSCLKNSFHHRSFSELIAVHILDDFNRALQGNGVILVEVHHPSLQLWTILHRLCHTFWKFSPIDASTRLAGFDLGLMFGHLHFDRWNIENLATLHLYYRLIF